MEFLDTYTVSFFGHRQIENFRLAEERLEKLIRDLLATKEYVEFLVGREGDFDQIVSSAVKWLQREYRDDNSSLIWVLPYPTAALSLNLDNFRRYYDEINVYSPPENVHPKAAYQARNRDMVDRSDMVVYWVEHKTGVAYQTMQYSIKKNKPIVNIAAEVYKI